MYSVKKYRNIPRAKRKINPAKLDAGDFILLKTKKTSIVPGNFDHVVLYCGRVEKNEKIWDRDNERFMSPGTHYVIHSTRRAGNGLGYSTLTTTLKDIEDAKPIEVLDLSSAEKQNAVRFLKSQLLNKSGNPIGPKYNRNWFSKQEGPENNKYYCSEAIWSAYKHCCNIDLDPNGESWKWNRAKGIAPDDLLDTKLTRIIS
ncbi:MAG: hypothetical protein GF347_05665 [Candidatus Moranbacteria bacterium]|nr:hypothetical protein [Candidatus Moranbacteria bacterium]